MHAVKFTADQSLLDFIQAKLDKLDTFHDRIIGGEVFLRLDGADSNKVKEKIVEVRLLLPGKELFVKEHDKSFESATDRVMDVLKDKLVRFKLKRNDISSQAIADAQTQVETEDEVFETDEL
jgi:putative sigma-54 modulation protein